MKSFQKSYVSTEAETTIDLRAIGPGGVADDVFLLADIDIEVVGNDAAVTLEVIGPFSTSQPLAPEDNSFAIGGDKKLIEGFAVGSLVFTRVGTTEYNINICRTIRS